MSRRARLLRRLAVAVAVVVLLVVGLSYALDPLATWRTRRVLAGLEGMKGEFADVEVSLWDLSYAIDGLRIEKLRPGGDALPFLAVTRARFGLYWKELLRGHLVATVDLYGPTLNLLTAHAPEQEQGKKEAPKAGRGLEALAPLRIDRAQVKDGEIRWIDAREPGSPQLRLHGIEATLENFATRPALAKGEPTVLAGRGTLQRTGATSVFVTADPLAKKLTFAGQGRIQGLRLTELSDVVGEKSGIAPEAGVLDLSLRFRAEGGALSGGVRPIVKNASTKPVKGGLGNQLKSALADASLEIFGDDVPGRDAVATTIPIRGSVDDPKAQLVPTVLGVLRNAFVRGLAGSLQGLPPPTAKKKESVPKQARRALSPDRGPPRAQPTGNR
jgi:hypothetical protein